ncbi:MAG: DUF1257 domain-containing protein [Sedimentisphaerales bacterium]
MGAVLILTPVIIASWPAITAAVAGAVASMGLVAGESVKEIARQNNTPQEKSVEVDLSENQTMTENIATDKEIVFTKGSIEFRIKRNTRGQCSVCVKGKGHSEVELKQMAEEFTQKMTQCFIYNKVVGELKNKDFQVINEEVSEDQSIRIHVRRWVD